MIGPFVIKSDLDPLIARLRELDTITTVKGFGESGLKVFCERLCDEAFGGCDKLSLRPIFRSTGIAGDDTCICHVVWNDEIIAAALAATRSHFNIHVSHVVDLRPTLGNKYVSSYTPRSEG